MPRARPSEVKLFTSILTADTEYEKPEDQAEAMLKALDQERMNRTQYVAVMQMPGPVYVGVGPYPGRAGARQELDKLVTTYDVVARAVVPVTTPEQMKLNLENLDKRPDMGGDWERVQRDVENRKRKKAS